MRVVEKQTMRVAQIVGGLLAVLMLFGAAEPAAAQTSERVPIDAATTGQKAAFIENLLTRSVAARTIGDSGEQAPKEKLGEARALVDEAKTLIANGQYKRADEKLDQALALINAETRRLSKAKVNGARDKEAYEKRLHAVELFLQAYERVAADQNGSAATKGQINDIRQLIAEAKAAADRGEYDAAKAALDTAYQIARGDIRTLRQGQTLTRSLDFATAAEEYDYERGRNDSHFMLLKFALSNNQPAPSMLDRIARFETDARSIREQAERNAAAGLYDRAIGDLNESTQTLLKAIRMSGIFVPG